MQLRWHGHSCFELINAGHSLVFDPHDGAYIGIPKPNARADIVLVSHEHRDHNAVDAVAREGAIVQRGCGSLDRLGFKVTSFSSWHDEVQGAKRGCNAIFKVVADGVSLVHMGDLGVMPDKEAIGKVKGADIFMIPVGGTFTVDPASACQVVDALAPRVVVPMHYRVAGLKFMLAPVDAFLSEVCGRRTVRVGNAVDFTAADLPDAPSIWVFKR